MAELKYFGKEVSLEEYIKLQVLINKGTNTRIQAYDLQGLLDDLEIKYKKTVTKKELLNLFFDYYNDFSEVARILRIGVKVNQYTEAFSFVTKADIKRLERFGILKVVGKERYRAYGKYLYASLYDLEQFLNMTETDMKLLLEQYPKGKRKK